MALIDPDLDSEPGPLLLALKAACRRHMMRELPVDPTAVISELDFRSLHQDYATWKARVPQARPRRVHVSREMLANPARMGYGEGLAAVLREIANGNDLRPRMSTAVEHAYAPWIPPSIFARRRPRPDERHIDRLLADWGLHHLHLKNAPHPTCAGFVDRSRQVLFVAFMPEDAYLVDVAAHESHGANWSALALLEVVVRNWPDAGILTPMNFVTSLVGGNWSDEDRKKLRRAGVSSSAVEIDGRVWSAGGQGLTGVPMRVMQHCMGVTWALAGFEPTEDQIRTDLAAMAIKHSLRDQWQAITHGEEFGFYSDGVFVRYGSLLP